MKQNDNLPNETVVRLRQAIRDGKITYKDMEFALNLRLEEELKKPDDEIDGKFVSTMVRMLDDTAKVLYPNEQPIRGQTFEELMAAVDKLDEKPERKERPKLSYLVRVAAVIPVVLVCMMVYDVFIGPKGFDISHTDDGQQRIAANVTQAPALLGESIAVIESGSLTTTDVDEVKDFLGYIPSIPTSLNEKWLLSDITASRNEYRDVLIISYEEGNASDLLVYSYARYRAAEDRSQAVEQDDKGEYLTTPNGFIVYVTQNVDSVIGAWETTNETCYVNGSMSIDVLLSVVDEITITGG